MDSHQLVPVTYILQYIADVITVTTTSASELPTVLGTATQQEESAVVTLSNHTNKVTSQVKRRPKWQNDVVNTQEKCTETDHTEPYDL